MQPTLLLSLPRLPLITILYVLPRNASNRYVLWVCNHWRKATHYLHFQRIKFPMSIKWKTLKSCLIFHTILTTTYLGWLISILGCGNNNCPRKIGNDLILFIKMSSNYYTPWSNGYILTLNNYWNIFYSSC